MSVWTRLHQHWHWYIFPARTELCGVMLTTVWWCWRQSEIPLHTHRTGAEITYGTYNLNHIIIHVSITDYIVLEFSMKPSTKTLCYHPQILFCNIMVLFCGTGWIFKQVIGFVKLWYGTQAQHGTKQSLLKVTSLFPVIGGVVRQEHLEKQLNHRYMSELAYINGISNLWYHNIQNKIQLHKLSITNFVKATIHKTKLSIKSFVWLG